MNVIRYSEFVQMVKDDWQEQAKWVAQRALNMALLDAVNEMLDGKVYKLEVSMETVTENWDWQVKVRVRQLEDTQPERHCDDCGCVIDGPDLCADCW